MAGPVNVVVFAGDHARHGYFLDRLQERVDVNHVFVQSREPEIPRPSDHPSRAVRHWVDHHFALRRAVESRWFGDSSPRDKSDVTVFEHFEGSEGEAIQCYLATLDVDLLVCFGTRILPDEVLALAKASWNVHGGLSPWFRGDATMFWPSYLLQPQFTGVTLHEMTSRVDAGSIVHQTGASLVGGDGLHDLSARTLARGLEECAQVIAQTVQGTSLPPVSPQAPTGRVFAARDWRPEMCRVIYETFDDAIVDLFLAGDLGGFLPRLYVSPFAEA